MSRMTGSLALLALLSLFACKGTGATDPNARFLDVFLSNDGDDTGFPIHILAPAEPFADSNRIQPGGGRTVEIRLTDDAGFFRAGRNGMVIDDVTCVLVGPSTPPPSVVWNGDLVCEGW